MTLGVPASSEGRYVMTAPGVLGQISDTVTVEARSSADTDVSLAVARVYDAQGWLANEPYLEITGVDTWESLGSRVVSPANTENGENADADAEAEEPANNEDAEVADGEEQPAGPALESSDMWFEAVTGTGSIQVELTSVADPIVIIAGSTNPDGAPAVNLTWEREVPTPLMMPGIIVGAIIMLAGVIVLVMTARRPASPTAVAPTRSRSAHSAHSAASVQSAGATPSKLSRLSKKKATRRTKKSAPNAPSSASTAAPWDAAATGAPAPSSSTPTQAAMPWDATTTGNQPQRDTHGAPTGKSTGFQPAGSGAHHNPTVEGGAPAARTAAGITARTGSMPTIGAPPHATPASARSAHSAASENPREGSRTGLPYGLTPEAASMLDTGTLQAIGFTRRELRELTDRQRRPNTSGIPTVSAPGQPSHHQGEPWLPRETQTSASNWRAAWGLSSEATPTPDTRMRPGQYSHTDDDAHVVDEALARHQRQQGSIPSRGTGEPAYTPVPAAGALAPTTLPPNNAREPPLVRQSSTPLPPHPQTTKPHNRHHARERDARSTSHTVTPPHNKPVTTTLARPKE